MGAEAEDEDEEVDQGKRHQPGQDAAPHHFLPRRYFASVGFLRAAGSDDG